MDHRDRYLKLIPGVDLALVCGILLQAAAALWWAADQGSDNRYQNIRLAALENKAQQDQTADQQILDRLARIEERLIAQSAQIRDLKK